MVGPGAAGGRSGLIEEHRVNEPSGKKLRIFIVSGSTGRTCDEVVHAALAQFDHPDAEIVPKTKVRSARAAKRIVAEAAETGAVICHSLVEPKIRAAVLEQAKRLNVPIVDVLGPVLTLLEDHLGQSPRLRPGLSYRLRKEYFDRIDAISFTLNHDDGCGIADLAQADVVLVGVSRVSKSVTCFYLAYRGVRAANVPLVLGCEPPAPLLALDPHKVIGLTMNPRRLAKVRETRIEMMGRGPLDAYGQEHEIRRELEYAHGLMARHGWRKIDVSYMSVEEVAKEVLSMLERKG